MINWVKYFWKFEKDEDWVLVIGFNNLEVIVYFDNWFGRMIGIEGRECRGVEGVKIGDS